MLANCLCHIASIIPRDPNGPVFEICILFATFIKYIPTRSKKFVRKKCQMAKINIYLKINSWLVIIQHLVFWKIIILVTLFQIPGKKSKVMFFVVFLQIIVYHQVISGNIITLKRGSRGTNDRQSIIKQLSYNSIKIVEARNIFKVH